MVAAADKEKFGCHCCFCVSRISARYARVVNIAFGWIHATCWSIWVDLRGLDACVAGVAGEGHSVYIVLGTHFEALEPGRWTQALVLVI